MACGMPTIVTAYSAPLDYLTPECSYLIPVAKLVPIDDPVFYPDGNAGMWAEPDIAVLRELLRHVFQYRDDAQGKGERAREMVCDGWTWEHAAMKALSILHN